MRTIRLTSFAALGVGLFGAVWVPGALAHTSPTVRSTHGSKTENVAPTATAAQKRTFRVRVSNVSTGVKVSTPKGPKPIPLSPGPFAVFTGENPAFTPGTDADEAIENLAEDGFPKRLHKKLKGSPNVTLSGVFKQPKGKKPALTPGQSATFTITARPGQKLVIATMFVPSNDLFYAPASGIKLFRNGRPVSGDVTRQLTLWDAGTEQNQPFFGPATKPVQPRPDFGPVEDEPIRRFSAISDSEAAPPQAEVIKVSITPLGTRKVITRRAPTFTG